MSAANTAQPLEPLSAETLESLYVQLNTQLLLHLQSRDTLAALQTADAIRTLCLPGTPPTEGSTATPTTQVMAPGERLYRDSPAALLLSMRSSLTVSSDAQREQEQKPKQLLVSESGQSPRSPTEAGRDEAASSFDDTTPSLETPSTSTDNSSDSMSSSSVEEGEQRGDAALQAQPSQPFLSLTEALIKWCHIRSPATTSGSDTKQPSHLQKLQQSQYPRRHSPLPTCSSAPAPVPIHPSPPLSETQLYRRKPPTNKDGGRTAKEYIGSEKNTEAATADTDVDADEAWERMQEQVAKEMARLAVVRKHR